MQQSPPKHLINAALGRPTHRKPIWFLRQAGRYLPEYRAIRAEMSFLELCRNPRMAAEVTLQPLKRFDLDAAIIFADILLVPTAMGQTLTFAPDHGPILANPIRSAADVARLSTDGAGDLLSYVGESIALTKKGLAPHQTMIGFAGAPFTVASYMIEGSGTKTFAHTKSLMFHDPSAFAGLMDKLVAASTDYLAMQVAAGAETLMLFDTWAGNLAQSDLINHVAEPTQRLLAAARSLGVPVIYYPGMGSHTLAPLGSLGADVIAVDWRVDLDQAARILRPFNVKALQGNLDPLCLGTDKGFVQNRVREVLESAERAKMNHIFNVGHGLLPTTSTEALTWAIEAVRAF